MVRQTCFLKELLLTLRMILRNASGKLQLVEKQATQVCLFYIKYKFFKGEIRKDYGELMTDSGGFVS